MLINLKYFVFEYARLLFKFELLKYIAKQGITVYRFFNARSETTYYFFVLWKVLLPILLTEKKLRLIIFQKWKKN